MLNGYNDVLTVDDVAQILHIGKNTVYRLLNTGEIHSRRIGKKYIIPKKCVIDYIEAPRYTSL